MIVRKEERQIKKLHEIAAKHGLSKTQADEIWRLYSRKIYTVVNKNRKVDGKLKPEDLPILMIQSIGKLVPDKRAINYLNISVDNLRKYHKEKNDGTTD